jgi:hypothetical protein
VADEKHRWLKGERVYIATTAAQDCLLGASVALSASQAALEKASGVFASEAQALDAAYAPETVNTDGWQATQGAWKALFTHITVILCFLHAFLNIRDRALIMASATPATHVSRRSISLCEEMSVWGRRLLF